MRRQCAVLLALLIFLVLPNLLFNAAGFVWFIDRGLVNVDYLLIGLLVAGRGRRLIGPLLAIVVLLDVLFSFAPAYHFGLAGTLEALRYALALHPAYVLLPGLAALVCAWSIVWAARRFRPAGGARLAAAGACLMVAVVLFGVEKTAVLDSGMRVNLVFSTLNSAGVALRTNQAGSSDETIRPVEHASSRMRGESGSGWTEERLVLIVVESLGVLRDETLARLLMEPVRAAGSRGRVDVDVGRMPFSGSTVPAELRELCAVEIGSLVPSRTTVEGLDCLPRELSAEGYTTLAVHGFLGTMFARNTWYPALHFDRVLFGPDLKEIDPTLGRCGTAFRGTCDLATWELLVERMRQSERPIFVYWLTLSTHLPVPDAEPRIDMEICQRHPATREDTELCGLVAWQRALLDQVVSDVEEGLGGAATVLLVGDHAPPFMELERREQYDPGAVPWVLIKSRKPPLDRASRP